MLNNDKNFLKVIDSSLSTFPFQQLAGCITSGQATSCDSLYGAFIALFHGAGARVPSNIVFIWAMDHPYRHDSGNKLESTVVYIEMSKGTISGRWPKGYFKNLTRDCSNVALTGIDAGLQELADKNFSFYSRLIQLHGPLRVWYATLENLNSDALKSGKPTYETVREWERVFIKSYRSVHGAKRRPLKNRQD